MSRVDAWYMVQRRTADAGLDVGDRQSFLPRHRHNRKYHVNTRATMSSFADFDEATRRIANKRFGRSFSTCCNRTATT